MVREGERDRQKYALCGSHLRILTSPSLSNILFLLLISIVNFFAQQSNCTPTLVIIKVEDGVASNTHFHQYHVPLTVETDVNQTPEL